ncbi:MAG: LacI family DNA-binding transcriptional regulator [Chloroflexi bacterium]|nr:LacI family DNA-binding transcriptional regulator [Chloroflexota bacterium]
MPPKDKPSSSSVTIRDVARLAGVSPATVSKVMNNAPYVSEEKRVLVRAAADKLNFRPNSIARSLKMSRTATLGLITDDLEGVFTMSMMRGVEDVVSAQGFSVFLCNSYGDPARERMHLQVLIDKKVDGIILLSGYRVRQRGAPALPLGDVPVVYLYQYTDDTPVHSVIPDDFGGAALGAHHLLSLGKRRIAIINGPGHYEATRHRLAGVQHALEIAGVPFDPALVRAGKWYESSGYTLARDLMTLPDPPDAIFCMSDSIAAGAMGGLHELGVRIPDDVALIGFDNRKFAAHQRPPLTTVALPLVQMGHLAGELLLRDIREGSSTREVHRVACELVIRQSCGASRLETA